MLQGLSMDEEGLYDAEGEIIKMCVEHNIKWERVKGPSYEKPIGSAKSKYWAANYIKKMRINRVNIFAFKINVIFLS